MIYYLDTSALVKRYVTERGTQWLRNVCQPASGNDLVTVSVTKVETAAALAIKLRQKGISLQLLSADADLLAAAQNEGVSVDNPALYP